MRDLIDKLEKEQHLERDEYSALIGAASPELYEYLSAKARDIRHRIYGHDVFIRGLIEFTNYCKNDCLYCGIRRSNKNAARYRLTKEEILSGHASVNGEVDTRRGRKLYDGDVVKYRKWEIRVVR